MVGNVLHFISIDEKGEEIRDKGIYIDTKLINGDTFYIIKSELQEKEIEVAPEMVTSLY